MKKEKTTNQKFMELLIGLEAVEFLGLCKFLGVKLMEDSKSPRDFADLLSDLMEKFQNLNRTRQRELLQILKKVHKEEGD